MDVTNVKVEFVIGGETFFDHDEVTKKMGIIPTYLRKKGEKLRCGKPFHMTEWGFETEYEPSYDINDQLNKVTEQLKNKECIINEICSKYEISPTFVIVVNVENGEFPAMYFNTDFIKFAASINADIGFDPYFYSD